MKIVRAKFNGEIFYGELVDDEVLRYEGSPFVVWEPSEEKYSLDEKISIIHASYQHNFLDSVSFCNFINHFHPFNDLSKTSMNTI